MQRSRHLKRVRGQRMRSDGSSYDPDVAAYIAATGELFPDALNALVVGLKNAGLWHTKLGSLKKAIGVPDMTASLVDLRNPALVGTAHEAVSHSPTQGWSFNPFGGAYLDTGWNPVAENSEASSTSGHIGLHILDLSFAGSVAAAFEAAGAIGFSYFTNGSQSFLWGENSAIEATEDPATPGYWIGTRTSATDLAIYFNGAPAAAGNTSSTGLPDLNVYVGAVNYMGTAFNVTGCKVAIFHAGAGLSEGEAAILTSLLDDYAVATGNPSVLG